MNRTRRVARLSIATFAVALLGLAPLAAAETGSGATFGPSVRLTELHATTSEANGFGGRDVVTVHWRRERLRRIAAGGMPVERGLSEYARGTHVFGWFHGGVVHRVSISRQVATFEPDGVQLLEEDITRFVWPLLARVRSGGTPLTEVTVDGRRLLRGTIRLAANSCAGLRAGARVVDLDPRTLVPVRVVERRAGRLVRDIRIARRAPRASDFAPLTFAGRGFGVTDDAYVRRTPAQAAALLAFPVSMPAALPDGFVLDYTGSALQGGYLGPEASFPRSRGLFFASWHRGLEPLSLTIRGARSTLTRDWDESDPFGGECAASTTSTVMVGALTARYATGENGSARLWWRDGTTLYTLAGPLSAEQLVAIAASLTTVEG